MRTAYLKVSIGVLLALGINCYRRESESGEGFSQGWPGRALCAQWEHLGTGPHPASVKGGVREGASLTPQDPLHRDFKGQAFTFPGGKYFRDLHTLLIKVRLSDLTLKCYGLYLFLPYILVQPLPLLSTPASLPPPIMPLWDHTTPLRGPERQVDQRVLSHMQAAAKGRGHLKAVGAAWGLGVQTHNCALWTMYIDNLLGLASCWLSKYTSG